MAAHALPQSPQSIPQSLYPRFRAAQQARLVRSLRVTSQQAPNSDGATQRLETALDVLDEKLSMKIDAVKDALVTFQQSLPDSFMPRRESMEIITGLRGQVSTLDTRLVAMEEWRLAETKAAAERNAALEAKISAAVVAALKDNATTATTAATEITRTRSDLDGRTLALMGTALFFLLGWLMTVVYFVATHPAK